MDARLAKSRPAKGIRHLVNGKETVAPVFFQAARFCKSLSVAVLQFPHGLSAEKGEPETPARRQNAPDLQESHVEAVQPLECGGGQHQVERAIGKGKRFPISGHPRYPYPALGTRYPATSHSGSLVEPNQQRTRIKCPNLADQHSRPGAHIEDTARHIAPDSFVKLCCKLFNHALLHINGLIVEDRLPIERLAHP